MLDGTRTLDRDISVTIDSLKEIQRRVAAEIASYPTPIAGCDAQFNHLLAQRARIAAALTALGREPFIPTPRAPFQPPRPNA